MLLISYWKATIDILTAIFFYPTYRLLNHYFINILCHNICHYDYLCVFLQDYAEKKWSRLTTNPPTIHARESRRRSTNISMTRKEWKITFCNMFLKCTLSSVYRACQISTLLAISSLSMSLADLRRAAYCYHVTV